MIVLEHCTNGALRDCLKFKLPWNLIVRICLDVTAGLSILHENGIVHRCCCKCCKFLPNYPVIIVVAGTSKQPTF